MPGITGWAQINGRNAITWEKKFELEKIVEDKNSDKELKKMAEIELADLLSQNKKNEKKLKLFLLPKYEVDIKNAIIFYFRDHQQSTSLHFY